MSETDLDHPPVRPTPETQATTPWESIDPAESAPPDISADVATQVSKPPADFEPVHAEIPQGAARQDSPFASTAITAVGAEMAVLASEIQALVNSQQFNQEQEIITAPAESPEEQVVTQAFLSDEKSESSDPVGSALADAGTALIIPDDTSAKAYPTATAPRFSASSIEPPIEPATIDETPWATMDDEGAEVTVSPAATGFIEIPRESPLIDRLANLDLSDADLDALDSSDISELNRGDLAVNRRIELQPSESTGESIAETEPGPAETILLPQESTEDAAVTFAMTDPVAASIPQMGIVSEAAEEERAGDATVLVPERAWDIEAGRAVAVPQFAVLPETETEPQWELETELSPSPVTTGGAWTIPLMCLGIGLIACCLAIPQIDFNRRLRYEQHSLAANLESVQKQVAVNDGFLKKVMDDPTLAERLAGRQMNTIRKGQKVIPLEQASDEGGMSPFALMAIAPPADAPPYRPIRGTIANICYDARGRLYLLGSAMAMVAVGLVMGFGSKQTE